MVINEVLIFQGLHHLYTQYYYELFNLCETMCGGLVLMAFLGRILPLFKLELKLGWLLILGIPEGIFNFSVLYNTIVELFCILERK